MSEKLVAVVELNTCAITYLQINRIIAEEANEKLSSVYSLFRNYVKKAVNPSTDNCLLFADVDERADFAYLCSISPFGFCFCDNVIRGELISEMRRLGLFCLVIIGCSKKPCTLFFGKEAELTQEKTPLFLAPSLLGADNCANELICSEGFTTLGGMGAVFSAMGLLGLGSEKECLLSDDKYAPIAYKNMQAFLDDMRDNGKTECTDLKDLLENSHDFELARCIKRGTRYAAYHCDMEDYARDVRGIEANTELFGKDYYPLAYSFDYLARLISVYKACGKIKVTAKMVYALERYTYALLSIGVDIRTLDEGKLKGLLQGAESIISKKTNRKELLKEGAHALDEIHTINNFFGVIKAFDMVSERTFGVERKTQKKLVKAYYRLARLNRNGFTKEYYILDDFD